MERSKFPQFKCKPGRTNQSVRVWWLIEGQQAEGSALLVVQLPYCAIAVALRNEYWGLLRVMTAHPTV